MPTQRGYAYRLGVRRTVAALLRRDPDHPTQGTVGPVLAGVVIAALLAGGLAAWQRLADAPVDPTQWEGVLLVEDGSGARYLWRDGRLHPVRNAASAVLLLGDPRPRVVTVPEALLADLPRGAPLGIPGAPDPLPPPERMVTGDPTVCSVPASTSPPTAVLLAGTAAEGGTPLTGQGLLVTDPDGALHLLWDGRRYRVRDPEVVVPALGWTGWDPVPVAPALPAALPAGPDLARIPVPGLGGPSAAVPEAPVGQVVVTTGQATGPQYALVLDQGLVPLSPLQADLLLSDPTVVAAVGRAGPLPVPQARFAALPRLAPSTVAGADLPARVPPLASVGRDESVCARVPTSGEPATLVAGARLPDGAAGDPEQSLAVVVPPGHGMVVDTGGAEEDAATDGAVEDSGTALLADGRWHPATPEVLRMLGYADVTPVRLPAELLVLVPRGPALDPAEAAVPSSGRT